MNSRTLIMMAILSAAITACGHTSKTTPQQVTPNQPLTLAQTAELAREAHAVLIGQPLSEVTILEAREVTWSSGAIGCPKPGLSYTQALVDGFLVVLSTKAGLAYYHASGGRPASLCPEDRRVNPIEQGATIF